MMKQAQELRQGNVILIKDEPFVVLKGEYNKSGRNAAVMKLKLKNLFTGNVSETVYKADEKFEAVVLDRKTCTYSYFADPMYVFMDEEFNQYEVEKENMENVLPFLEEGMSAELVFFQNRPIAVELPPAIVREVEYTEPAVRGDTTGKVMKPARIKPTGFEIMVPAFVEIGDKIEIDTATLEYRRRIQ